MLGFAQTHQGLCPWTLPPFEKGGPKLYHFSTALTIPLVLLCQNDQMGQLSTKDNCPINRKLFNFSFEEKESTYMLNQFPAVSTQIV